MNFNLYLDDPLVKKLDKTARELGESRSGLIRLAVREWLEKKQLGHPSWPRSVLELEPHPEIPPFEDSRRELLPPREDPFA